MPCYLAVALDEVPVPDEGREDVKNEGVIKGVSDPLRKGLELEEVVALAHGVELWIAVQEACRDELIKNAEY